MHGIHHKVYEHLRHRFGRAKCFRSLHWVTITQLQVAPTTIATRGRPAGQVARSDESGHVASQGRMGPLK